MRRSDTKICFKETFSNHQDVIRQTNKSQGSPRVRLQRPKCPSPTKGVGTTDHGETQPLPSES